MFQEKWNIVLGEIPEIIEKEEGVSSPIPTYMQEHRQLPKPKLPPGPN
jgi:hypothetical protein